MRNEIKEILSTITEQNTVYVECNFYWGWVEITVIGENINSDEYIHVHEKIISLLDEGSKYKWELRKNINEEGRLFLQYGNNREFRYGGQVLGSYAL